MSSHWDGRDELARLASMIVQSAYRRHLAKRQLTNLQADLRSHLHTRAVIWGRPDDIDLPSSKSVVSTPKEGADTNDDGTERKDEQASEDMLHDGSELSLRTPSQSSTRTSRTECASATESTRRTRSQAQGRGKGRTAQRRDQRGLTGLTGGAATGIGTVNSLKRRGSLGAGRSGLKPIGAFVPPNSRPFAHAEALRLMEFTNTRLLPASTVTKQNDVDSNGDDVASVMARQTHENNSNGTTALGSEKGGLSVFDDPTFVADGQKKLSNYLSAVQHPWILASPPSSLARRYKMCRSASTPFRDKFDQGDYVGACRGLHKDLERFVQRHGSTAKGATVRSVDICIVTIYISEKIITLYECPDDALEIIEVALSLTSDHAVPALPDRFLLRALLFDNMAFAYFSQGRPVSAMYYVREAVALTKAIRNDLSATAPLLAYTGDDLTATMLQHLTCVMGALGTHDAALKCGFAALNTATAAETVPLWGVGSTEHIADQHHHSSYGATVDLQEGQGEGETPSLRWYYHVGRHIIEAESRPPPLSKDTLVARAQRQARQVQARNEKQAILEARQQRREQLEATLQGLYERLSELKSIQAAAESDAKEAANWQAAAAVGNDTADSEATKGSDAQVDKGAQPEGAEDKPESDQAATEGGENDLNDTGGGTEDVTADGDGGNGDDDDQNQDASGRTIDFAAAGNAFAAQAAAAATAIAACEAEIEEANKCLGGSDSDGDGDGDVSNTELELQSQATPSNDLGGNLTESGAPETSHETEGESITGVLRSLPAAPRLRHAHLQACIQLSIGVELLHLGDTSRALKFFRVAAAALTTLGNLCPQRLALAAITHAGATAAAEAANKAIRGVDRVTALRRRRRVEALEAHALLPLVGVNVNVTDDRDGGETTAEDHRDAIAQVEHALDAANRLQGVDAAAVAAEQERRAQLRRQWRPDRDMSHVSSSAFGSSSSPQNTSQGGNASGNSQSNELERTLPLDIDNDTKALLTPQIMSRVATLPQTFHVPPLPRVKRDDTLRRSATALLAYAALGKEAQATAPTDWDSRFGMLPPMHDSGCRRDGGVVTAPKPRKGYESNQARDSVSGNRSGARGSSGVNRLGGTLTKEFSECLIDTVVGEVFGRPRVSGLSAHHNVGTSRGDLNQSHLMSSIGGNDSGGGWVTDATGSAHVGGMLLSSQSAWSVPTASPVYRSVNSAEGDRDNGASGGYNSSMKPVASHFDNQRDLWEAPDAAYRDRDRDDDGSESSFKGDFGMRSQSTSRTNSRGSSAGAGVALAGRVYNTNVVEWDELKGQLEVRSASRGRHNISRERHGNTIANSVAEQEYQNQAMKQRHAYGSSTFGPMSRVYNAPASPPATIRADSPGRSKTTSRRPTHVATANGEGGAKIMDDAHPVFSDGDADGDAGDVTVSGAGSRDASRPSSRGALFPTSTSRPSSRGPLGAIRSNHALSVTDEHRSEHRSEQTLNALEAVSSQLQQPAREL